jgi:tetratricopeptide (TPR) repeat protein/tRNA A-37 threonylcarbamoyl transferase component Bud32
MNESTAEQASLGDWPSPGDESDRRVLALLLNHQSHAWRSGDPVRVEDYLAQQPRLAANADVVLDLIYHEIVLRERAGESPRADEYMRRFPELASELQLQFDVEGALELKTLQRATDGQTAVTERTGPRSARRMAAVPGYEMLGELGRGGMGVVYKARQIRLNRVVALKMILAGDHAGPEAAVRFLNEAESIARLHHPHIVQIYAFGDCDGHPYFEMEYVGGGNLSDRLDGKPRPARESARLIELLAGAIHEAHRHGIVHRDLKPANILLSADGVPKIADFGLAKWLDIEGGPTKTQWIVGSPSYMAPEQAGPGPTPIGPAADVYSLGAILYELLTGRPPFQAATVLETLERVRSQAPTPPSRLQPRLPRDLVTICLKCLEKDPTRRYLSAAELAEDLRRFESGRAIQARPVSAPERVWRWCRREPAVAALAVALLAGLAGVATQWRRAEWHLKDAIRERGRAERNTERQIEANIALKFANDRERTARRLAQERFDAAMQALRKFEETTKDAALLREPRFQRLRASLLETALGFYRELQASLEEDASPGARAQLADAYARVGRVNWELGLLEEALAAHRRSLALFEQMASSASNDSAVQDSLGKSHAQIGFTFRTLGRPTEALISYQRARRIQERLALADPTNAYRQEVWSWTLSNLGVIYLELGLFADAIRFHEQAIAIHEDLVRRAPETNRHRSDLGWARRYLGLALVASGDPEAALAELLKATALHEHLVRFDPHEVEFRWRLARCLDEIGRIHSLSGRPDDGAKALRRAAELHEGLVPDNPVLYGVDLVRNHLYRASQCALSGRADEADACLRQAEAVALRSSPLRPDLMLFDMACASSLWSVAGQDGVIMPAERERRARRAIVALRRACETGSRNLGQIRGDPLLNPLRSRPDFQELVLDLSFPVNPFGFERQSPTDSASVR